MMPQFQMPRKGDSRKESRMVINTNVTAQTSARLLSESSTRLAKSLSRLSSGSKIVSPEDDAAGMAVSMRFDAQIHRISAASDNVGNAISFSQTQDGFLQKVSTALDRMSELATLAQDVTKGDDDRELYNKEFQTLQTYITDISSKTFNGVSLFTTDSLTVTTDSDSTDLTTQGFNMAGIDLTQGDYQTVSDTTATAVTTRAGAASTLSTVMQAIKTLASDRAGIGANITRLTSTKDQLAVLKDNMASANSRIKDVDVAEESTEYARYNILVQAGTAMLAQANTTTQSVLKLLG
jgi:flagellin